MSLSLCRVSPGRQAFRQPQPLILFERLVSFPLISPCVCLGGHTRQHPHTHTHKHACRHQNKKIKKERKKTVLSREYTASLRDLAYTYCTYLLTDESITSHLSRHILLPLRHTHTHSHKHALCDAVPQAGCPLHLPHLLCPQLNFDLSFQRQRLVYVNCACKSVCVYTFMQSKTRCFSQRRCVLQLYLPSSCRLMR